MIVTLTDFKLRIGLINTLTNSHTSAEIECSTFDISDFASRNLTSISRSNLRRGNRHNMIFDRAARFALKVKVNVLCHIKGSILIRNGLIIDTPNIIFSKSVFYTYLYLARESLFAILGDALKYNANIITINSIVPTNGCAVVTISAETMDLTVQLEELLRLLRENSLVIKAEILAG